MQNGVPLAKQQSFEESEAIFDDEIQSSTEEEEEPRSSRSMQSGKASCCESSAGNDLGQEPAEAQKVAAVGKIQTNEDGEL